MEQICKYVNCDNAIKQNNKGPKKKFCSTSCKSKFHVSKTRRENKAKVIKQMGGKCVRCGFDEHQAALVPHHVDPSKKEFAIGDGNIKSLARMLEEAKKCILLCQNCHCIVHATNDSQWIKNIPI